MYHYFEQEYEEMKKLYPGVDLTPLSKFRERTGLATGATEKILVEILKEEEERNAGKRRGQPKKQSAPQKKRMESDRYVS